MSECAGLFPQSQHNPLRELRCGSSAPDYGAIPIAVSRWSHGHRAVRTHATREDPCCRCIADFKLPSGPGMCVGTLASALRLPAPFHAWARTILGYTSRAECTFNYVAYSRTSRSGSGVPARSYSTRKLHYLTGLQRNFHPDLELGFPPIPDLRHCRMPLICNSDSRLYSRAHMEFCTS